MRQEPVHAALGGGSGDSTSLGLGALKIAAGAAVLSVLKNLSTASTVRAGAELSSERR